MLSDEVIAEIARHVNAKLVREEKQEEDRLQAKLEQTDKEINSIINAIMAGMNSQALKDKMNQLEVIKVNLEAEIVVASSEVKQEVVAEVTEEQVKEMVADMKYYVMERDLPQCKQLIKDFVEAVVVYRDHVEVKFNMVFLNTQIRCKVFKKCRRNSIKID